MTFRSEGLLRARRLREQLARRTGSVSADEIAHIVQLASLTHMAGEMASLNRLLAVAARVESRSRPWVAEFFELQRISIALGEGRFDDARELFRAIPSLGPIEMIDDSAEGLAAWETSISWPSVQRNGLLAHAYLSLARICSFCGAYDSGTRFGERGLAHAHGEKKYEIAGHLSLTLAEIDMSCGRFDAAQRWIDDIDAKVRDQPSLRRTALQVRARLAVMRGDLATALREATSAFRLAEDLDLRAEAKHLRADLAELRLMLNQFASARALIEQEQQDIEDDPLLLERLRRLMSVIDSSRLVIDGPLSVFETQNQGDEAEAPLAATTAETEVRSISDREMNHLDAFEAAASEVRRGIHDDQASQRVAELAQNFENDESPFIRARTSFLVALTTYAAARRDHDAPDLQLLARAERSLSAAASAFEKQGALLDLSDARRWLAWCAYHRGDVATYRELQVRNAALAETIAAPLRLDERVSFFMSRWLAEEEQLAERVDAVTVTMNSMRGPYRLRRARVWPDVNACLDQMFGVKEALSRHWLESGSSEASVTRTPVWKRLLRSPRRLTIVITVLPTKTIVFYLGLFRLDYDIRPVARYEIRECVSQWHEQRPSRVAATRLATLLGLGERLARLPRRIDALTIVPDDALHGFPFAVLPLDDERLLVDRFAVSIAPQPNGLRRRTRRAAVTPLIIGVDRGGPNEDVIDHRDEIQFVARRFKRGTPVAILHNDSARPENVLRELPAANFVHLVCHGRFVADAPDDTGIVLSDGKGGVSLMSLKDLSRMDLRGLRHATIMACWTADAYVRPGRWTSSVPDVLCRAGAAAVIAPLWQADTRVTTRFLELLYENLLRWPRDRALQRTMLEARRSEEFVDESQWAAFQLYGTHQRVRLKGFDA